MAGKRHVVPSRSVLLMAVLFCIVMVSSVHAVEGLQQQQQQFLGIDEEDALREVCLRCCMYVIRFEHDFI
jgi:sensor domain CHASE-containing protein